MSPQSERTGKQCRYAPPGIQHSNFYLLETMSTYIPYRQDICNEQLTLASRKMPIPTAPGLGIEVYEEALANYPYQPINLQHYTGNLTGIRPNRGLRYF